MRFSRRSLLSLHALLLVLVLVVPVAVLRAQSDVQMQTATQIPPAWNDAVARLASRIGNLAGTQKVISLTVKNISSLTDADVAGITDGLIAELARLGVNVGPEATTAVEVTVTLSQGQDSYIWVGEVRGAGSEQTAMVSAPINKEVTRGTATTSATVVLQQKLVWQQADLFLDFYVQSAMVGFGSTAVILEPHRLAFYSSPDLTIWQASTSIDLPNPALQVRDNFGHIDEQAGNAYVGPAGWVFHPTVRCTGGFDNPKQVQCSRWTDERLILVAHPRVPGHEQSEKVFLTDRCGEGSIVLSTGNGDWTQPDTIQGYLVSQMGATAAPSGSEIGLDGPVMAFHPIKAGGARAVVHNLKTGNYEGYVVTATCGH